MKATYTAVGGTHPYPCIYYIMRGIAGLRKQRARGRNVSDPDAASGQSLARLLALGDAQGTAVGGI